MEFDGEAILDIGIEMQTANNSSISLLESKAQRNAQQESSLSCHIHLDRKLTTQQLDALIKQRYIEIELLKRSLAVAKQRLSDTEMMLQKAVQGPRLVRHEKPAKSDAPQSQGKSELSGAFAQEDNKGRSEADVLNDEMEQLRQIRDSLQKELEESRQELAKAQEQAQTDIQLLRERINQDMHRAVEREKQRAREEQGRLQADIKRLNQQLHDSHDQSGHQLEVFRANSKLQMDQVRQEARVAIEELMKRMNQTMAAKNIAAEKEQKRLEAIVDDLNQQLQTVHAEAGRQLLDYEIQQKKIDQTLEKERKRTNEEQAGFKAETKRLKEHLKAINTEFKKQREKRLKQKRLLEKERKYTNELKSSLAKTQKDLNESEQRIANIDRNHQETMSELKQVLESSEDAWKKLAKAEVETQSAKHDLALLKNELEQEITNLQAELEYQHGNSDMLLCQKKKEIDELQQLIEKFDTDAKKASTKYFLLKNKFKILDKKKNQYKKLISKLQKDAKTKCNAINIPTQKNHGSSRQQLESAIIQGKEQTTLEEKIMEENRLLKQKIKDMREVQQEMEGHLKIDGDDYIKKLQKELQLTKEKLKQADNLALNCTTLLNENKIHESAIEILSEDLDTLPKENATTIEERDGLTRELLENKKRSANINTLMTKLS